MPLLAWILTFTALGGVLSALAASLFLLASEATRARVLPHLVSFATGALLSAALLGLLPHAIDAAGPSSTHAVGLALLAGLLIFFVLEKMVLWRHCHQDVCEGHLPHGESHRPLSAQAVHVQADLQAHARVGTHVHPQVHAAARDAASASLILVGDGIHNVLDGVLIAAAFMTDVHLGIVTALAVFAHEIPQEIGDLAILLHGGMSRRRALTLNLLTSLTSVLGGLIAYFALDSFTHVLPYALAIAASSFLYIAVADLIPGLHRRVDPRSAVRQLVFILLGMLAIYLGHGLAH